MVGDRTFFFDLETADAGDLWTYGPDFVRLASYAWGSQPPEVTTDINALVRMMGQAEQITGHNVSSFDLLALVRYHQLDLDSVAGRIVDTMLVERQWDPPEARSSGKVAARRLDLDSIGERRDLGHKTLDLKELAKRHGGLDRIPTDDPEYVAYAKTDVELVRALDAAQGEAWDQYGEYLDREHQIALIAAQIMLAGFRVDLDLIEERSRAMDRRKEAALERLAADWAVPVRSAAPLRTNDGQDALREALASIGIDDPPETATGRLKTGEDDFIELRETYGDVHGLLGTCIDAVGGREIYPLVAKHAVGDRVHPAISMKQASGRWSVTSPALTTLGKRDGRHVERDVFLPEPGHVILCVDLSQVDMRAVAGLCGDTKYAKLFEPGRDAHGIIAGLCWGGPLDRSNPHREVAKTIAHGWNYGRGWRAIGKVPGVGMDRARRFNAIMRKVFPDLVGWQDDIRAEARDKGILDNGWGRRMRVTKGREYTQAPALMGQGAARDIMMEGLLRLPESIRPWLRGVIHDEVVLSVPEDVVHDVERQVRQALSFEWRGIPVVADEGEWGSSWGAVYAKPGPVPENQDDVEQPKLSQEEERQALDPADDDDQLRHLETLDQGPIPDGGIPDNEWARARYSEEPTTSEEEDQVETGTLSPAVAQAFDEAAMADAVWAYRAAGWSPLPLDAGAKGPPPDGFTGRDGARPTAIDIAGWLEDGAYGNVAIRLPKGVVGLDVDDYGSKTGARTLDHLVDRLGPLPDAPISTAREGRSGILLFRVPLDLELATTAGDGIDVIQAHHRYLVVWPSMHPEGQRYRWDQPAASQVGPVPLPGDLEVLPLSWMLHLARSPQSGSGGHPGLSAHEARRFLESMPEPASPCRTVRSALAQAEWDLKETGQRHDAIRDRVLDLVRLGEEGHHGAPRALRALRSGFIKAVTPDRPSKGVARAEWDRLLDGALAIVASSPSEGPRRCCGDNADLLDRVRSQEAEHGW